jgi:hypothetical protein
MVLADFEEPGDHDIIRKVISDFEAAGVPAGEGEVRRAMQELMVRASDEIKAGM